MGAADKRKIEYAKLDDLRLDPMNPRLGRNNASREKTQKQVLELMQDWSLEELATSFLESGFWPQEALIVVNEELYGRKCLVVVEGNRRLAALTYLRRAFAGQSLSRKWGDLVRGLKEPKALFEEIPYIQVASRKEVEAFLGFRHVTGIMEWNPAEKAEYIAKLVDDRGMTYEDVMRKIGSKTEPVRRNYISYRVLLQMQDLDEPVSLDHVEEKFSVLFLSLREVGVQRFLKIDIKADPKNARCPVPKSKLADLASFAAWLFGTEKRPPLFTDSRHVTKFGKVLESQSAVQYLRSSDDPSFELAVQKAGADEPELVERVLRATDEIEQTLGRVHLHLRSDELRKAVDRFGRGAIELLKKFGMLPDSTDISGGEH